MVFGAETTGVDGPYDAERQAWDEVALAGGTPNW
jgi:hypothetical protein